MKILEKKNIQCSGKSYTIMEYSRQHHIKRLWLSSSEQGKHLYARKGFIKKENEMELF